MLSEQEKKYLKRFKRQYRKLLAEAKKISSHKVHLVEGEMLEKLVAHILRAEGFKMKRHKVSTRSKVDAKGLKHVIVAAECYNNTSPQKHYKRKRIERADTRLESYALDGERPMIVCSFKEVFRAYPEIYGRYPIIETRVKITPDTLTEKVYEKLKEDIKKESKTGVQVHPSLFDKLDHEKAYFSEEGEDPIITWE